MRGGIALLVFVPGSWSPGARRLMTELAALHPAFEEAGIAIVMIVTQDAGSLRRRLEATPPPFPVLADVERNAARDYGVFRAFSWDGIGVTRPAAFVIDREGAIRFLYVGERDHDVPDARSLLRIATWLRDEQPPEAKAAAEGVSPDGLAATAAINGIVTEAGSEASAIEQLGGEALIGLAEAAAAADAAPAEEPPAGDETADEGPTDEPTDQTAGEPSDESNQTDASAEVGPTEASVEPSPADESVEPVAEGASQGVADRPQSEDTDGAAGSDAIEPAPELPAPLDREGQEPSHPVSDAAARPTTGEPTDH